MFKESYTDAAKKTVGHRTKEVQEMHLWISADAWTKIETWKKIKEKILNADSSRQVNRTHQGYKIQERVVKRSVRKDKTNFIESLASEAEDAAEKGELSTVHKISKQLCCNNTNRTMPVKDEPGKVITTEKEQSCKMGATLPRIP